MIAPLISSNSSYIYVTRRDFLGLLGLCPVHDSEQSSAADKKMLKQDYIAKLKSSLLKIKSGRHHVLDNRYEQSIFQMAMLFFLLRRFCLSCITNTTFTGFDYLSKLRSVDR